MKDTTGEQPAKVEIGSSVDDPYAGQDCGVVPMTQASGTFLNSMNEAVSAGQVALEETVENISSKVAESVSDVKDDTRDLIRTLKRSTRRTKSKVSQFVEDNPLAVGLIAFLLGAVVGLAFPSTVAENRLMGKSRQKLLDRAQNAAQEFRDKAEDVASDVVETVKEQFSPED